MEKILKLCFSYKYWDNLLDFFGQIILYLFLYRYTEIRLSNGRMDTFHIPMNDFNLFNFETLIALGVSFKFYSTATRR